jgi:phage terminase small subunit
MDGKKAAKKPRHAKGVAAGQQVLVGLEDAMGYDICLLADPRHEVFCREYAVYSNASKAYAKAFPGTSENSCRANACRLIANDNIKKRVAEIQAERLDRLEVTHEKIVRELAKMAFVDERDFYHADGTVKNIPDMDPDVVAAVESVKVRVMTTESEDGVTSTVQVTELKHGNKREALKLLMSQRGMLKESVLHEGEIGVTHSGAVGITDDVAKLDELRKRFRGMAHGAVSTAA